MLLHYASLSSLHFVFAFILAGALAAEAFILRLPIDGRVARVLLRADMFYGVSSVLLILAGISRVLWGEKGWAYYQVQPFFWAKMATFLAIGLLSIVPTRAFTRWVKAYNADAAFAPPEADVKKVRRLVMIEVHLIALLLLFATLMARGIGQG
jgi:putative membrane protein